MDYVHKTVLLTVRVIIDSIGFSAIKIVYFDESVHDKKFLKKGFQVREHDHAMVNKAQLCTKMKEMLY